MERKDDYLEVFFCCDRSYCIDYRSMEPSSALVLPEDRDIWRKIEILFMSSLNSQIFSIFRQFFPHLDIHVVIITDTYSTYSHVQVLWCTYITVNDTQYIMNGNRNLNEKLDVRNETKLNWNELAWYRESSYFQAQIVDYVVL